MFDDLVRGVYYALGAGVKGDLAEFGTMTGASARAIACAMRDFAYLSPCERKLHLFDSFEGLPDISAGADLTSPHVRAGVWKPGACKGISDMELSSLCAQFIPGRIAIHKGWFADTVPVIALDQSFALLHVDSDLYSSAMDILAPLLSRGQMSAGALILFDDWNCNHASPAFGERRAWSECVERFDIEFSDEGAYGAFGHKFIVHGYGNQ